MMAVITKSLALVVAICFASDQCHGHGTPIFVSVNAGTGQLVADNGFDPGTFQQVTGGGFADAPGLAVTSQFVGLAFDERLHVNVVQELLYWDGLEVQTPADSVVIERPIGPGPSAVNDYTVTASSGYQTGMLWGAFDGTAAWHADGNYVLESINPQQGIYGIVLQIESELHVASDPFLVPLIFDPSETLGAANVAIGVAQLRQAIEPLPTADFDRDTAVDADDLAIWREGFGIVGSGAQVQGDATSNGNVSGDDFLAWQLQFNPGFEDSVIPLAVPEPSTLVLLLAFFNYMIFRGDHSS